MSSRAIRLDLCVEASGSFYPLYPYTDFHPHIRFSFEPNSSRPWFPCKPRYTNWLWTLILMKRGGKKKEGIPTSFKLRQIDSINDNCFFNWRKTHWVQNLENIKSNFNKFERSFYNNIKVWDYPINIEMLFVNFSKFREY